MLRFIHTLRSFPQTATARTAIAQKNGYLYIHYYNLDAMNSIAGFNARQILRGKCPYPVLVASETEKQTLLTIRKDMRSREGAIPQGRPESQTMRGVAQYLFGKFILEKNPQFDPSFEIIKKIALAIYSAVENLEVRVGLSQLTADDKLYILGHGLGGKDLVRSRDDNAYDCSMKQYAQKLKEVNLSKSIRDLRVVWCESANHETALKKIRVPPLQAQPTQRNYTNFFLWKKMIPAKALSAELTRIGYKDIDVHGYEGFGLVFPIEESAPDFNKLRAMQITETHKISSEDPYKVAKTEEFSDMKRASIVRKTYRNGCEVG